MTFRSPVGGGRARAVSSTRLPTSARDARTGRQVALRTARHGVRGISGRRRTRTRSRTGPGHRSHCHSGRCRRPGQSDVALRCGVLEDLREHPARVLDPAGPLSFPEKSQRPVDRTGPQPLDTPGLPTAAGVAADGGNDLLHLGVGLSRRVCSSRRPACGALTPPGDRPLSAVAIPFRPVRRQDRQAGVLQPVHRPAEYLPGVGGQHPGRVRDPAAVDGKVGERLRQVARHPPQGFNRATWTKRTKIRQRPSADVRPCRKRPRKRTSRPALSAGVRPIGYDLATTNATRLVHSGGHRHPGRGATTHRTRCGLNSFAPSVRGARFVVSARSLIEGFNVPLPALDTTLTDSRALCVEVCLRGHRPHPGRPVVAPGHDGLPIGGEGDGVHRPPVREGRAGCAVSCGACRGGGVEPVGAVLATLGGGCFWCLEARRA